MSTAVIALQNLPKQYNKFSLKNVVTKVLTKDVKEKPTAKKKSTRLKNKEREVAADIVKSLRVSFTREMSEICESYFSTKLTAKFRGLVDYEDGRNGTRPFFLSKYGRKLNGFDFNTHRPFRKIFKAKYHLKQGSRRGQVIMHFPAFVPEKAFNNSKEATNFKINTRLVALSDFGYDGTANLYNPINSELHGKFSSYDSGMLPMLKMPLDPMTSQLSLGQNSIPENTSLFLIMCVSFYIYEQGRFVHLSKDGSMQIKQVF